MCCIFRTLLLSLFISRFFFNDTATTEIYTLSLHDALPILHVRSTPIDEQLQLLVHERSDRNPHEAVDEERRLGQDRKSTRLNSSHSQISYAVFCLKKKKTNATTLSQLTKSYSIKHSESLMT